MTGIRPFYVSPLDTLGRHHTVSLILLDVSGSMKTPLSNDLTRFEAAKAGAKAYLKNLDPDLDEVAVVPFESHNVVRTIQGAVFTHNRRTAEQQIDTLQVSRNGNTALYLAMKTALEKLQDERVRQSAPTDARLVLMTDGEDDVQAGDDGVGKSAEFLEDALQEKEQNHIQTVAIGLVKRDLPEKQEMALLEIGGEGSTYFVTNAEELEGAFARANQQAVERLQITFKIPLGKELLGGENHSITASIPVKGRVSRLSAAVSWITPATVAPNFAGPCDPEEKQALSELLGVDEPEWLRTVRPILVFIAWGGLLLICWFLIPRLIWPERYAEELPAVASGGRWAAGRGSSPSAPSGGRSAASPTIRADREDGESTRNGSGATFVPSRGSGTRSRLK
ncbi:MAG: vWA domain-containing protein [Bryobacteraceae bacterium]